MEHLKLRYVPKCSDCHKRMPSSGTCPECKVHRRRLWELRHEQMTADTPAARAERERRIPIYARLVEAKVELFS